MRICVSAYFLKKSQPEYTRVRTPSTKIPWFFRRGSSVGTYDVNRGNTTFQKNYVLRRSSSQIIIAFPTTYSPSDTSYFFDQPCKTQAILNRVVLKRQFAAFYH